MHFNKNRHGDTKCHFLSASVQSRRVSYRTAIKHFLRVIADQGQDLLSASRPFEGISLLHKAIKFITKFSKGSYELVIQSEIKSILN